MSSKQYDAGALKLPGQRTTEFIVFIVSFLFSSEQSLTLKENFNVLFHQLVSYNAVTMGIAKKNCKICLAKTLLLLQS